MTIGVGRDSFDVLKGKAYTLYCGMGKGHFTIVKNCKENKNMLHTRANEKSDSTTVDDQSSRQNVHQNDALPSDERMVPHTDAERIENPPEGDGESKQ